MFSSTYLQKFNHTGIVTVIPVILHRQFSAHRDSGEQRKLLYKVSKVRTEEFLLWFGEGRGGGGGGGQRDTNIFQDTING